MLLLVHQLHEEDGQQHLHHPGEEERAQQVGEVEAQLGAALLARGWEGATWGG